jgi:hypothetical protein
LSPLSAYVRALGVKFRQLHHWVEEGGGAGPGGIVAAGDWAVRGCYLQYVRIAAVSSYVSVEDNNIL